MTKEAIPLDLIDDIIDYAREKALKNKGKCNVIIDKLRHEPHVIYELLQPYIDKHDDLVLCAMKEISTRKIYLYIKVRLKDELVSEE